MWEIYAYQNADSLFGIFNAAALVSQAKETGQTAATVNATNVAKMLSRLPASSMGMARWVMNRRCCRSSSP